MLASLAQTIGNTPLVECTRINPNSSNRIFAKLEGNNPGGSVKDRAAYSMFTQAEVRSDIKPGDTIIEATSGNTGIALAMMAAIKGYHMILIMPDDMSEERRLSMSAYGAEIISIVGDGMEAARDLADEMQQQGKGIVLDQFNNQDNALAHYRTTGPELWQQTNGTITHFVASMGTTGTISGTSRYLKEQNSAIRTIGLQPDADSRIPGIRRWPQAYLPKIFDPSVVDETLDISLDNAEQMMRRLAKTEGIMAGVSSGGAMYAATEISKGVQGATIVCIICDRGDRYLSTGVYNE